MKSGKVSTASSKTSQASKASKTDTKEAKKDSIRRYLKKGGASAGDDGINDDDLFDNLMKLCGGNKDDEEDSETEGEEDDEEEEDYETEDENEEDDSEDADFETEDDEEDEEDEFDEDDLDDADEEIVTKKSSKQNAKPSKKYEFADTTKRGKYITRSTESSSKTKNAKESSKENSKKGSKGQEDKPSGFTQGTHTKKSKRAPDSEKDKDPVCNSSKKNTAFSDMFERILSQIDNKKLAASSGDKKTAKKKNLSVEEKECKSGSGLKIGSKKAELMAMEESNEDENDQADEDYVPSKKNDKEIVIIYDDFYGGDEDVDRILNDEDEECNSEDEMTFMKENTEAATTAATSNKATTVSLSTEAPETESDKLVPFKGGSTPPKEDVNIEQYYKELSKLKKQLIERIKQNPKSKGFKKALKTCNEEISKLVMETRRQNTKEYYELTNDDTNHISDLEYFKKKLSYKEQKQVMKDYKEINGLIFHEKPYILRLLQSNIPAKYKATVLPKLKLMSSMEPGDSEYHKLKTWVDTFMRIPFNVYKDLSISMNDGLDACNNFMRNAKDILDECTYGLNDTKMQILQLVGQWIANPKAMGTAIAIYGPKGTGKTSLSKDGISKIFGRDFAFISLGGSGDSSFLEGHSYTYEGSTWGKIVQILIESRCMNPIIYFDELDKLSDSPRGQEITGILTHLTDTSQNNQFHDKYFAEVDFDLSRCLFIFSYNDENAVNPILRDRMYRIETKGYNAKEKTIIAKKYLLPKIREQVNFKEEDIIRPDETIQYIISNPSFTQNEEGVRNLKRCLEIIHTKLNLFRLMRNTEEIGLFENDVKMNVKFPFTVGKKEVDLLIKNDATKSSALLSMYV